VPVPQAGDEPAELLRRRKQRSRRAVDHELVAALVRRERQLQPRLGTRKVHHRLKGELAQAGVRIGRTGSLRCCAQRTCCWRPCRRKIAPTQSYHNLPLFRNQVKETVLERPIKCG